MEQFKNTIAQLEVGSFTKKNILTASEDNSLKHVHDRMQHLSLSHIPVCCKEGNPVGIIAERDIRAFYLSADFGRLLAKQIMQTKFLIFPATASLFSVARALLESHSSAAIIVSDIHPSLEIFTVADGLKALDQIFQVIS